MITLFRSNETDFTHNGIGNLDAYIQNPVVEEEINGLYSFSFKYPLFAPHGLEIEGQSILRVPVPEMEDQLFRVYRHVKSMGYITVSCYHIFYDLSDNFIEDTNIVEKDGQGAIQQLGGATQFNHNFRFFSDIQTVANARLVRKNVVASILDDQQANSFVSRWGGELIRNNFDIRMNQSAGSDRGFTVKYRKNLTGYEADVDESTVYTRIMPKGFDGLLLPEKYVDSQRISNYVQPKIKMIEYDVKAAIGEYADDEDAIPLEDAYDELRRLASEEYSVHKIDIPTTSYKVNFVTLDQTEEYKDLQDLQQLKMGDMATIDHEEDNFKVTAKLVKYRWDPIAKRYLSAELGSIHDGITTQFTDINAINRKVDEVIERTNIIQATADGKSTIYRGESEPVNPNLRDLWYKPNGAETEMYQFVDEGGQRFWKLIADTADTTSVRNDVDQALEDSQTAKNTADQSVATANLASQNAVEAINQAQDAFDDAQLALTTAQGLTNRMSSAEGDISTLSQTTQSFATRIENAEGDISTLTQTAQGLQTRVADAEDNITSVTQLATGMQTRLTNAEGSINTLTTTASSLESTISSVRDDLDGLEIGGRNLLRDSGSMKSNTSYMLATYYYGNEPLKEGERYTISIKYRLGKNRNSIRLYSSGGYRLLLSFTNEDLDNNGVATRTFTMRYSDGRPAEIFPHVEFYQFPNDSNLGASTIEWVKIEKGNKATDWTPAPEDMATQSQFTQLSDNINLRVMKDDIINQINISTEDILISGKKLILDGDTTVTGTFKVSNANITSVDAGKMTTGTLDAGQVNIINLNASNIKSGTLDAIDITGGRITQNSSGGRVEMYNGKIQSYRRDELAIEITGYQMKFYNSDNTGIGTIYPITSNTSGNKGIGLEIGDGAHFAIGEQIDGVLNASLAIQPYRSRTFLSGPNKGAIPGSQLDLYANRRILSSDNDFISYDQPSISLRQGQDTNNLIMYYGGVNRRADAIWEVRHNYEAESWRSMLLAESTGVTARYRLNVRQASGFTQGLRLGSDSIATSDQVHVITRHTDNNNMMIYPQRYTNQPIFSVRSHNGRADYRNDLIVQYNGDIEGKKFVDSSLAETKENIKKWDCSALDIINQSDLYEWTRGSDKKEYGFVIGEGYKTPDEVISESGSGISNYSHRSLNTKAIQELNTKVNKHMESTALKFAELEQRLQKLEVA